MGAATPPSATVKLTLLRDGAALMYSNAPMSAAPWRAVPRWSVPGASAEFATLMAGLAASSACVRPTPPLFASGASGMFATMRSLGACNTPLWLAIRLLPPETSWRLLCEVSPSASTLPENRLLATLTA